MSKVSVSQAAELTGKSRETINKATKDGRISFSHNASNHKEIAIAELERVFPLVKTYDEIQEERDAVSASQPASDLDTIATDLALLREKLAGAERMNEMLTTERERERRQLEDEIELLKSSLERAQDQHNKALLLITDQSDDTKSRFGQWEEAIQMFEKRLDEYEKRAKREQAELKQLAKRRISRLQQELADERSKSLFTKLFGG